MSADCHQRQDDDRVHAGQTLVLGLGNDILCDDAAGLRVAAALRERFAGEPRIVVAETSEMGLALLDFITGYDDLVLVDAVQTGSQAPGHVHEVEGADLPTVPAIAPHFLGVGEVLALGRKLGARMPQRVTIFAIEVQDPLTVATRMTSALESALPGIVAHIADALAARLGQSESATLPTSTLRLRIIIRGAVQGVGFRPFVYRLATGLGLKGWVGNSTAGVLIEAEGAEPGLREFLLRLEPEKPPRSFIQSLESSWLDPAGYSVFEIRPSDAAGAPTTLVLPDIATCPDCLRDIFDPANRRYFYPFTNCTHCGPRFSIIEALPYDRPNTSMKGFRMCPDCQAEYENPEDRRFHAQPNACPACGPQLELWDQDGQPLTLENSADKSPSAANRAALTAAADAIRAGRIVALKGIGGFQLLVAAHHEQAVVRLRERKHREEKPLALMFPSLEGIRAACEVSPLEERLLRSPEAPIVLLRRSRRHAGPETGGSASAQDVCMKQEDGGGGRLVPHVRPIIQGRIGGRDVPDPFHAYALTSDNSVPAMPAPSVAPGNPFLGVMLPYTPLHHLLLSLLGFPVVATSGNLSDDPICIDERDAVERLRGIADVFLVHNRPIVRQVDDSVALLMAGRELVLRRARGYAPLPVPVPSDQAQSVLGVGAHLKNTVTLWTGSQAFVSQHIGDLETDAAYGAFERVIADFEKLYSAQPRIVVADAHPDYLSTQYARKRTARSGGPSRLDVQHHVAHVLSCMAENELEPPALGAAWDGTGYGLDGTVWGGEFFLATAAGCERVAHWRTFRLPGGDKAVREPRRTALGILYELFGESAFERTNLSPVRAFTTSELASLRTMLQRGLNSPLTSSVGRLFDAVAALAGLRQQVRFEGQAAMELEFALDGHETDESYPVAFTENAPAVLDWAPLMRQVLTDLERQTPAGEIAAKFHNALADAIVLVARRFGQERVVLSGGCFQNRYLTERAIARLRAAGFHPYWHQRVPPNDGGISLGQVVAALRKTV